MGKNVKIIVCIIQFLIGFAVSAQMTPPRAGNNVEISASELLDSAITISWSNALSAYDSSFFAVRYVYNGNNLETSQLNERYDSVWEKTFQYFPNYNNSNFETQVLDYSLVGNTSVWGEVGRDTFIYDINGNVIDQINQYPDAESWYNRRRNTFTYTNQNNLAMEIDQSWAGSAWSSDDTILFSYDVNNRLVRKAKRNGALIQQDSFSYDSFNNRLSDVQQNWVGGAWVNYISHNYTYNTANECIFTTYLEWNQVPKVWIPIETLSDTYDSLHFVKTEVYKLIENQGYPNQTITNYYYHEVTTAINNINETNPGFSIYPNPASNKCNLHINGPNEISSARVLDVTGREVMSLFENQQLSSFTMNCTSLQFGIYFIEAIDNAGKIVVRRLVKE